MKFRSYFLAAAGVAIVVGSIVFSSSYPSNAKAPDDVVVVNTSVNPVPTQAQGTTTVAGTIQAEQSGNWNVGIAGTPTFEIGNNTSSPVPVIDVENPAHHPFQFFATFSNTGGNFISSNQIAVPAHKRLVIETVTVQAVVPTGQKVLAQINMMGGGVFAQHNIMLTPQGSFNFNLLDYFAATESVRLYADQGSAVPFNVTRSSNDAQFWGGQYTVSGYFVDVP